MRHSNNAVHRMCAPAMCCSVVLVLCLMMVFPSHILFGSLLKFQPNLRTLFYFNFIFLLFLFGSFYDVLFFYDESLKCILQLYGKST